MPKVYRSIIKFSLQNSFVAISCIFAVASASPYGYYGYPAATSYAYGSPYAGYPYAAGYTYAAAAPAAAALAPLSADSKALIAAGIPRLNQAAASLNTLAKQLPSVLANIDPATKGDIAKVNGIIADVCAKAMAEIRPTSYLKYTNQGLAEMCTYINKIGSDILAGIDNPAIFEKYTADLQGAIVALNAKGAELTL